MIFYFIWCLNDLFLFLMFCVSLVGGSFQAWNDPKCPTVEVKEVQHKGSKQRFAWKQVLSDSSPESEPEVQLLRNLRHQNIIQIHEVYSAPGVVDMVLELCTEGSMKRWLVWNQFSFGFSVFPFDEAPVELKNHCLSDSHFSQFLPTSGTCGHVWRNVMARASTAHRAGMRLQGRFFSCCRPWVSFIRTRWRIATLVNWESMLVILSGDAVLKVLRPRISKHIQTFHYMKQKKAQNCTKAENAWPLGTEQMSL